MQQQNGAGSKLTAHPLLDLLCGQTLPVQRVQIPLDGDATAAMDAVDDQIVVSTGRWTKEDRRLSAGSMDILTGQMNFL